MLGALAASEALPYSRASFEQAIRAGGVGVEASLKAFAQAFTDAGSGIDGLAALESVGPRPTDDLPTIRHPVFAQMVSSALREFPEPTRAMLAVGMRRLADYQDLRYVDEYLGKLRQVLASDRGGGGISWGFALTTEAARQIAIAMAYDDVIRVADLKIRSGRFARIRKEAEIHPSQVLYTTEFMHPGVAEVLGTLPRWLGGWIEKRPRLCAFVDRIVNKGRRVHTNKLGGFFALCAVAGMRHFRRGTLRHHREMEWLSGWLSHVHRAASSDYGLALEIVKNRRLVKGYSETHDRGARKFQQVMTAATRLMGRPDAAEWVRKLREAALADEEGRTLDALLRTAPLSHES